MKRLSRRFGFPVAVAVVIVLTACIFLAKQHREKERQRVAAAAETRFSRSLMTALALSGDLQDGPRIKQALQNIDGVLQEQSLAAWEGVNDGGPTLHVDRKLDLTLEVAKLSALFAPVDQHGVISDATPLSDFGELVGMLAEIEEAEGEEPSAKELVTTALASQRFGGGNSKLLSRPGAERKIRRLRSEGVRWKRPSRL